MSDKLFDHFLNPRNIGEAGEPGFTGRAGSLHVRCSGAFVDSDRCGAEYLEARFRAAGCEVLVASLSILTQRVQAYRQLRLRPSLRFQRICFRA
jgi:NifU-like protein involved in Fe-S cluster formation